MHRSCLSLVSRGGRDGRIVRKRNICYSQRGGKKQVGERQAFFHACWGGEGENIGSRNELRERALRQEREKKGRRVDLELLRVGKEKGGRGIRQWNARIEAGKEKRGREETTGKISL